MLDELIHIVFIKPADRYTVVSNPKVRGAIGLDPINSDHIGTVYAEKSVRRQQFLHRTDALFDQQWTLSLQIEFDIFFAAFNKQNIVQMDLDHFFVDPEI